MLPMMNVRGRRSSRNGLSSLRGSATPRCPSMQKCMTYGRIQPIPRGFSIQYNTDTATQFGANIIKFLFNPRLRRRASDRPRLAKRKDVS